MTSIYDTDGRLLHDSATDGELDGSKVVELRPGAMFAVHVPELAAAEGGSPELNWTRLHQRGRRR